MRMLVRVQMDTEAANQGIKDGSLPGVLQAMLERYQPEAAYFVANDGARTAYLFLDMADPAQLPSIAEPFFQALKAKIDVVPAMNADEVQRGIQDYLASG